MVKLIVIAKCVPEDVYLRSLEFPTHTRLAGEKKFSVVVREPEEWYIGRLAIEIKNRYESLYRRHASPSCHGHGLTANTDSLARSST